MTPARTIKRAGSSGPGRPLAERGRGALRVPFLARREEIASMLDAGHSQRATFEKVFPEGGISYSMFSRYVRRYIRKEGTPVREQKPASNLPPPSLPSDATQITRKTDTGIPGTIGTFYPFRIRPIESATNAVVQTRKLSLRFVALNQIVPIRPVRTAADYDQAISSLNELLDLGASDQDGPLADLVETLDTLIAAWEQQQIVLSPRPR